MNIRTMNLLVAASLTCSLAQAERLSLSQLKAQLDALEARVAQLEANNPPPPDEVALFTTCEQAPDLSFYQQSIEETATAAFREAIFDAWPRNRRVGLNQSTAEITRLNVPSDMQLSVSILLVERSSEENFACADEMHVSIEFSPFTLTGEIFLDIEHDYRDADDNFQTVRDTARFDFSQLVEGQNLEYVFQLAPIPDDVLTYTPSTEPLPQPWARYLSSFQRTRINYSPGNNPVEPTTALNLDINIPESVPLTLLSRIADFERNYASEVQSPIQSRLQQTLFTRPQSEAPVYVVFSE